jgi:hypothetical protein
VSKILESGQDPELSLLHPSTLRRELLVIAEDVSLVSEFVTKELEFPKEVGECEIEGTVPPELLTTPKNLE